MQVPRMCNKHDVILGGRADTGWSMRENIRTLARARTFPGNETDVRSGSRTSVTRTP
jgi:hypothetical protein